MSEYGFNLDGSNDTKREEHLLDIAKKLEEARDNINKKKAEVKIEIKKHEADRDKKSQECEKLESELKEVSALIKSTEERRMELESEVKAKKEVHSKVLADIEKHIVYSKINDDTIAGEIQAKEVLVDKAIRTLSKKQCLVEENKNAEIELKRSTDKSEEALQKNDEVPIDIDDLQQQIVNKNHKIQEQQKIIKTMLVSRKDGEGGVQQLEASIKLQEYEQRSLEERILYYDQMFKELELDIKSLLNINSTFQSDIDQLNAQCASIKDHEITSFYYFRDSANRQPDRDRLVSLKYQIESSLRLNESILNTMKRELTEGTVKRIKLDGLMRKTKSQRDTLKNKKDYLQNVEVQLMKAKEELRKLKKYEQSTSLILESQSMRGSIITRSPEVLNNQIKIAKIGLKKKESKITTLEHDIGEAELNRSNAEGKKRELPLAQQELIKIAEEHHRAIISLIKESLNISSKKRELERQNEEKVQKIRVIKSIIMNEQSNITGLIRHYNDLLANFESASCKLMEQEAALREIDNKKSIHSLSLTNGVKSMMMEDPVYDCR